MLRCSLSSAKIQKKSKQQFHLISFFYFPPKDCPSGSHQTIFPTEATEPTEVSGARYSHTDCTDMHRLGGYGIPAIPTQPLNYLPTEATEPTEVSDARYSPTDFADMHRLGGYDIPAIPTQPLNYLPTEFTHKIFWRRRKIYVHLCASVGGPSTPETSVGSACSVGEPYAA